MSGFEDPHGARVVPDDELRITWSAYEQQHWQGATN